MIELLKFALEGWQNFVILIVMSSYITFLLLLLIGAFKPIQNIKNIRVIKQQDNDNEIV